MTYDTVCFDSDGVLVTPTDRAHIRRAVVQAFEAFEILDPLPDHVEAFGAGAIEQFDSICAGYDLEPEAVWIRREECATVVQRALVESGEKAPYDDVNVVEELSADYGLGVVSNNQHATIEAVLEICGFNEYFDVALGREPSLDGFRRMKPEPYYLDLAIERLGADEPIYVGDSWTDIKVADRVGIDSVYIQRAHNLAASELPAESPTPTYVVDSLESLPEIVAGSRPNF